MLTGEEIDAEEAIELFLHVLGATSADDPFRLINAGSFVALAVGGPPSYFLPLDGDPEPGTGFAERHAKGETVPSTEWVDMVRQRLHDLVDAGADPYFLVRSLTHWVADWYRKLADTGPADENRAAARQQFLDTASDPEKLASHRKRLEADRPDMVESNQELIEGLHRLADKLSPVSAEEAAGKWAQLSAWQRDTAQLLAL